MRKTLRQKKRTTGPARDDRLRKYDALIEAMRFLSEVAAKLYGLTDASSIYKTVIDAFRASDSYLCAILLLTDDKKHLVLEGLSVAPAKLQAAEKAAGAGQEKFLIDLAEAPVYARVIECDAIFSTDAVAVMNEGFPKGRGKVVPRVAKMLGFDKKRTLMLPIRVNGRSVGVMGITPPEMFDDFIPSALIFSRQVSSALELAYANAERERSESRFRLIAQYMADVIWVMDVESMRFTYVGPSVEKMRGFTPEEIMAQPVSAALTPESEKKVNELLYTRIPQFLRGSLQPQSSAYEIDQPRKDGSVVHTEVMATILLNERGKIEVLGISRDITERKRSEEQINMLKHSIDMHFDGIYWMDRENAFVYVNDAGCKALGYSREELIGRSIGMVNPRATPEAMSRVWGLLREKGAFASESVHRRKDGSEFQVEIVSTYVRFDGREYNCGFARDITDRKRSEAMLLNVQKLESLAVLAGGIAHDFNNLLGGIFGYIDLAADISNQKEVASYLSKALGSIDRARGLTQQLLTFAKGGAPIKKVDKLNSFIRETTKFALSGSRIRSVFSIPDDLWACDFDRPQIGQVIDNIVINAQQAMPDGGVIAVSAENVAAGKSAPAALPAGDYVRISIADQGVGMPQEMLPRIFDPFYTTKPKGHGLGLATCYSIVNRHGGCIEVESEPGKGSTFNVYLPAAPGSTAEIASGAAPEFKGEGTILLMDDEKEILEITSTMLRSLGYAAVCVTGGSEALAYLSSEAATKQKITGMIFDLTIPGGMGGKETVVEVRKTDPGTPVFVTSGYAEDPIMANPKEYGFTASIRKPFRISELVSMLRNHMNDKS